jgi:hypothetical protein
MSWYRTERRKVQLKDLNTSYKVTDFMSIKEEQQEVQVIYICMCNWNWCIFLTGVKGSHSLTQHTHKVPGQRSGTWGMVRWPDITQLCTARYRRINLLLIGVTSVAITEQGALVWRLMRSATVVALWKGRPQQTENLNQVLFSPCETSFWVTKKLKSPSWWRHE